MRKGEVWRVRLPMLPGHTQGGERPTVIVQNDAFIRSLPTVWVVPFTSKTTAARFPGTVLVQPDGHNGLTVPSVALVFQLSTQDKRNFVVQLGALDDQDLQRITDMIGQIAL
ncbi:MAG: type II toxin-antitoxin system PemK/MazF family toxin [Gemmataceae bacterium]|nr:type II toxin-antitoxin system PemK/MazF family toxin [Gemmataceae bacterium]